MNMLYIWLAVICIGLLIESLQAGTLVSVWFSAGAIVPFFMSFWRTDSVWYITLQVIIFGVVTLLCLIFLRKIAKKTLFKNSKDKTNLDSIVGRKLKISSVDGEIVYVKINGVDYRAIEENPSDDYVVGEEVEVTRFQGNKVVIKKIKKGEN